MNQQDRPDNMAKQALETMDKQGQDTMLLFVMKNSATNPEPPSPEPRTAIMNDGTIIQEYPGHYCFSWTDGENKFRFQSREKPDALGAQNPESGRPTPFRHLTSTVPYDDYAIYENVMEQVFYEAAERAQLHYSCHDGVPGSIVPQTLANELSAAIQQTLLKEEISDHAWYAMDREAKRCAEIVFQSLPSETKDALVEYAKSLLNQDQNHQEPPEGPTENRE